MALSGHVQIFGTHPEVTSRAGSRAFILRPGVAWRFGKSMEKSALFFYFLQLFYFL